MNWKAMQLSGWGQTSQVDSQVARPERESDIDNAIAQVAAEGLSLFGGGRSYGDVALNQQGQTLLTQRLNRLLSFDQKSGELVCEPGVTFNDLLHVFLPRGYMAPVTPGTGFVTIGGAIANDVHGKNHDKLLSFGQHVNWIELINGQGKRVKASLTENESLFKATIGGLGLTGYISKISFNLMKASPYVKVQKARVRNLDEFIDKFLQVRDTAAYSVAWIDAVAKGDKLGRGILEIAEHEPMALDNTILAQLSARANKGRKVPFTLPSFALNKWSVQCFNRYYYQKVPKQPCSEKMLAPNFFYPLDSLHDWYKIYGKRGFYQFQCVLPDTEAKKGLHALLQAISNSGLGSFLAVLKTLGGEGLGLLSFPLKGFTLALDFPRSKQSKQLIERLHQITVDYGGRVYLAKDALLSVELFEKMYPNTSEFKAFLDKHDPEQKFNSDLARRLQIRT